MPDPFAHHPELRGLIRDPLTSFFREPDLGKVADMIRSHGGDPSWMRTPDEIDAACAAAISGHEGDLWVFGYGSLMWDPGILFDEVRYATLSGWSRRFCLHDIHGGRGTPEAPGLMVALDEGGACDGLAFRIAAPRVADEARRVCRRELLGPAYLPLRCDVRLSDATVPALTFAADHDSDMIRTDLSPETQARMIATGAGFLGSSLEYAENLARNLAALGLEDPNVTRLLAAARALAAD